jgi:hypothetical protein
VKTVWPGAPGENNRAGGDGAHPSAEASAGKLPKWLAFHEAGHAVAKLAQDEVDAIPGPFIRRVLIRPSTEWTTPLTSYRGVDLCGTMGLVEMDARAWLSRRADCADDPHYRHDARLDAIVDLAGPITEAKAKRMSSLAGFLLFCVMASGEDVRKAKARIAIADGIPDETVKLGETWEAATAVLRRHWRAVTALAEALLADLEIDGEEVDRIVAEAMPGAFPRLVAEVAERRAP